jgi:hypothetical protein
VKYERDHTKRKYIPKQMIVFVYTTLLYSLERERICGAIKMSFSQEANNREEDLFFPFR